MGKNKQYKIVTLLVCFFCLLSCVNLCSCTQSNPTYDNWYSIIIEYGQGSSANSISKLPTRFAKEDDRIGNFADGGITGFKASDKYKNPDSMFDCIWSKGNVSFQDGVMSLSVTKANGNYYGAEYLSDGGSGNHWGYNYYHGFYSVSMKPAKKSGVISSFFVYNGSPWNEIDIEFLGKDTTCVQFNYYINGQGGHEYVYSLGFDAAEEFHEYSFDWSSTSIVWYVDGKAVYQVTENIPADNVYGR
jgi:endoglucanase